MKPKQSGTRVLNLIAPLLLLFFIIYTAPHLVDHAFEDGHTENSPCIALFTAKNCQVKQTLAPGLLIVQVLIDWVTSTGEILAPYHTLTPISQRAPPVA